MSFGAAAYGQEVGLSPSVSSPTSTLIYVRQKSTGHTTVNVLIAFGNVDIYVPEGVNVDVGGFSLFGHRPEWGFDTARTDAPTVHVCTLGRFGIIDVWRVPHDIRRTYGKIFGKLKKRQRQLPA